MPSDAEAATREGGDETANAQTGAEVRALPPATFKTSPHEVPSPKPVTLPLLTRYVTYCNKCSVAPLFTFYFTYCNT